MAQLTRKSYQRKAIATGFGVFLTASLSATGFAAWAIASSATAYVEGNVDVFGIVDKSISVIIDPFTPENEGVIRFEPTKEDEQGRVRNDGRNFECLGFMISGSVSPFEYVTDFTIQMNLGRVKKDENGEEIVEIDREAEERFELAASEIIEGDRPRLPYITLPECWNNPIPIEDVNLRRDPVRWSHQIQFGWGAAFDGMNPSEYFDLKDEENSDEYLISDDDMRDALYDFYTTMTGMGADGASELDIERGFSLLHYVITIVADTSGVHGESTEELTEESASEETMDTEVSQ